MTIGGRVLKFENQMPTPFNMKPTPWEIQWPTHQAQTEPCRTFGSVQNIHEDICPHRKVLDI